MNGLKAAVASCIRCGVTREVRYGRATLCRDCKWVLSEAEREVWAA